MYFEIEGRVICVDAVPRCDRMDFEGGRLGKGLCGGRLLSSGARGTRAGTHVDLQRRGQRVDLRAM